MSDILHVYGCFFGESHFFYMNVLKEMGCSVFSLHESCKIVSKINKSVFVVVIDQ